LCFRQSKKIYAYAEYFSYRLLKGLVDVQGMPNIFEVKKEEILVPKVLNKAERARAEELKLFEDQQERCVFFHNLEN
jgi:hypothetical protein